ncbi:MAG: leucine-rich repeat protein [Saccharofermentanales bacterium]|jgi:uncharacterized protein YgiM (DUF1202 family)
MNKKLHLRIQALVLVLLLALGTFVIAPEQVLADTEVTADEETKQVAADEEVTEVTADEEMPQITEDEETKQTTSVDGVTPDVSDTEDRDDVEQPDNEVVSEIDTDLTDGSQEMPDESATATETATETSSDIEEVVETPEAEQVAEEAVADNPADQDDNVAVPDNAEHSRGTREYSPEEDFVFDPETGTITGYTGTSKIVNIPPAINNVDVKHIKDFAFMRKALESVTIPYGVETIGNGAFWMSWLMEIVIPDSVTDIGEEAFIYNNLTDVIIPDSVTSIGNKAFANNQLTSVRISNEITTIGDEMFANNKLSSVIIPNKVTVIGTNAFYQNDLTSVTIPSNVTTISNYAFSKNKLTSVNILNGVTTIGVEAFYENQLMSVTIPDSVENIGHNVFKSNPIILAAVPEDIASIVFLEGDPIVNPNLAKIMEKCFDYGVHLLYLSEFYIKANYNIRATPNGEIITNLWRPLYITGTKIVENRWLEFTYNGNPAYVEKTATTNVSTEITGYATGILNFRDEADGTIIGTIPMGYKINEDSFVKNLVFLEYNGKYGYIYASLLQKDPVQITRYVKTGSNIRSTPGGTIIEKLKMPIYVTGIIEGSYLKFTYNGKTAYVHLGVTTTQSQPITGYVKSKVNVRSAPNGGVIGSLTIGSKVSGTLTGNWVRFTYAGKTGYVYSSLLQADPVKLTCYVKAGSNIRSAPGGTIIATLKMPIFVTGTIQGSYLKFIYNGKTAYVAMGLTTTTSPPITGYTKSAVNVRSSPNGSVIGSLPANRKVSGTLVGNWVKFIYSGKTGYIYASLLK